MITEQERIVRRSQGYDIGFEYNGKKYWINSSDWNVEKEERLFQETGLRTFREETGNNNLVLYDPEYFGIYNGLFSCLAYTGRNEKSISQPINMSSGYRMFARFNKCKSLCLDDWDMSAVVDITEMFSDCTNLQSISLNNWDVKNITNMESVFEYSRSLQQIDLSSWRTSEIMSIYNMFNYCTGLQSLNLSDWDITDEIDMRSAFRQCKNLQSLRLDNWNIDNTARINKMFEGCRYLQAKYNTSDDRELLQAVIEDSNKSHLERMSTF